VTIERKPGGHGLRRPVSKLAALLRRGSADTSGAAAVFVAVALLLLAPLTLGLIDVYLSTTQRGQLQDALDTATLYVARSTETDADKIKAMGYGVLAANLNLPPDQRIVDYNFALVDGRKVVASASITPPGFAPAVWEQNNLQANSEVVRNSVNLEVAVVLDTTGSMSGQIGNLRTAAKDLVDLVVQDVQAPYYSKVALVPYAAGVQIPSAYRDTVRGAPREATAITKATKTSPVVITSADHGLQNGEIVYISGVSGMTELNNKEFEVAGRTADTFQLKGVNGSGYKTYSKGGTAQCRAEGCPSQRFTAASGASVLFNATNCATERTGAEAYTEAPPSTAKVGFHYAGSESNTKCSSGEIEPLTSSKSVLKTKIESLVSDGSTAGHIGLAWGWYMISPEWQGVWTGSSQPAAYSAPETMKVLVLMTDGAFNTHYCKGVNSKDGFGSSNVRINCNATNGSSFSQAYKLCDNIKAKGITIYTVGFNIGSDKTATDFVKACATSPQHVYLPSGGTALKDAFKAIGQEISRLRISK
jgi:Flp pilus assembly protein TadG